MIAKQDIVQGLKIQFFVFSSTFYTNPSCVLSPTFQFMGPNVHPA